MLFFFMVIVAQTSQTVFAYDGSTDDSSIITSTKKAEIKEEDPEQLLIKLKSKLPYLILGAVIIVLVIVIVIQKNALHKKDQQIADIINALHNKDQQLHNKDKQIVDMTDGFIEVNDAINVMFQLAETLPDDVKEIKQDMIKVLNKSRKNLSSFLCSSRLSYYDSLPGARKMENFSFIEH